MITTISILLIVGVFALLLTIIVCGSELQKLRSCRTAKTPDTSTLIPVALVVGIVVLIGTL